MNRFQRRAVKVPKRTDSANKLKDTRVDNAMVHADRIEEVLPPKTKGMLFNTNKPMTNRSCYFSPDLKDFAQFTEENTDQYQRLLLEQYGFDPVSPGSVNQLTHHMKARYGNGAKVENSSQYVDPGSKIKISHIEGEASEGTQWQNIDSADEIDKYIGTNKEKSEHNMTVQESVHISDVPRIKTIAEKFIKYKKNNIELRKLNEKVVCVEYDIYKGGNTAKPEQKMRAYFSVKPQKLDKLNDTGIPSDTFSNLKQNFVISVEDLKGVKNKEIEIIDGQIPDNKPYLDDLMRVLKRKQIIDNKKKKTSLDLLSLYEMAKKDSPPLDEEYSDTNLLSKAELDEIKQIILKKCSSSVHGISRRTLKESADKDCISECLVADLLREVTA